MKFVIITDGGFRYVVEADDVEDAIHESYDSQCGYSHIQAVVRIDG